MRADGNLNAGAVVLEFVAVPFGGCMQGKDQFAQHTADTQTALSLWASRGVPVVLVGAPRGIGEPRDQTGAGAINRDLAAREGQTFADSGVLLRDPWTGVYQQRLPCLAGESAAEGCDAAGLIDVRQEGHFCRVTDTSPCPVYSSGVVRFAAALAAAAARAAGSTPAPLPAPAPAPQVQEAVRAAFGGSGVTDPTATASLVPPEAIPPDFAAEPPAAATTTSPALTGPACRAIRAALKRTGKAGRAETSYSAPVTGASVDQIVHVLGRARDAKTVFDAYAAPQASKCLASVFGVVGVVSEPTSGVGDEAVTFRLTAARDLVIRIVRTGRTVTTLAYANLATPPPDDAVNAITSAAVTRTAAALGAAPAH
jgi:hypothetical protein